MRYKLFAVLVTCVVLLSFSFISANALSINYVVKNSLDQNAVPPLHSTDYDMSQYDVAVYFYQNANGYGYWSELYLPKLSGCNSYLVLDSGGSIRLTYVNPSSSTIMLGSYKIHYYTYAQDGTLYASGTINNADNLMSNQTIPFECYTGLPYMSNNIISWYPFYEGTYRRYRSGYKTMTAVAPSMDWSFTINDKSYDENGDEIGGGDSGGSSGCQCVDYTDILETIVANQGTQLDKLNQIISILQSNSNQVVVNAINDAVDDVNDNLNTPTKDVPSDYENEGIDDYNTESAATDEALDDFKDGNTFSDIFDDFDLTSFREAMEFWKDKFDDIIDTNSVFPVVITSVLTLGLIAVILNRKVGVG